MAGTIFATTLQGLRKSRGVTQEQLAMHLGVSPQAVSKWENGSYPDGDLLPQLADYFEVSIDYLYGRAQEKVSLEQELMNCIRNLNQEKNWNVNEGDKLFEQMLRCIWAMQIGCWSENKHYYERMVSDNASSVVSSVSSEAGFNYMRMNRNLEFFTVMKEPEDGFASYFEVTDELAGLFAFLGDKDNLKVLFYILSLKAGECVGINTVAKRLGIASEKAEAALQYLSGYCKNGNGFLHEAKLVNEHDQEEKVYTVWGTTAASVLILLAGADAVLKPPCGFVLQVGARESGWFERKELNFLNKKAEREERKDLC